MPRRAIERSLEVPCGLIPIWRAAAVFCGGPDAAESQAWRADPICRLDFPVPAARRLVLGGSVSVVDGVPERSAVLVSHFGVAA